MAQLAQRELPAATRSDGPYVGPYPLCRSDRLYGRSEEVNEVRYLLLAERIVLVHSRSGAGKTSLIEAGLLPHLDARMFRVASSIRVGRPPAGSNAHGDNPYLAATRHALQSNDPTLTLAQLLDARAETGDSARDDVLFFDQFEEVLSLDRYDREAKEAFFEQLGEALCDRSRRAIFAMREEYVGGLEPYLSFLPGQLRARFWLDYLDADQAREAIVEPAAAAGVAFDTGVAEALVERLRALPLSSASGQRESPYVDPVHLQVVCRRLWTNRTPGATAITRADLDRSGDVEHALEEFYAEQVEHVARDSGTPEREIRRWFELKLITERHTRGQVARHRDDAGGLTPDVTRRLTEIHLIAEGGPPDATWYELAHDRLIEPVLRDNARFRKSLQEFQELAERWERTRAPDLLLKSAALGRAQQWAREKPSTLCGPDREFLQASQEEHRARVRVRMLLGVLALAVLAVLLASLVTMVGREQVRTLMSRDLASRSAGRDLDDRPELALLLAGQGVRISENPTTRTALLAALDRRPALRAVGRVSSGPGLDAFEVRSMAFTDDGTQVLLTESNGTVRHWDIARRAAMQDAAAPRAARTSSLPLRAALPAARRAAVTAVDPTGQREAIAQPGVAGPEMRATVRLSDGHQTELDSRSGDVSGMAFSADGDKLAIGTTARSLLLWTAPFDAPPAELLTDHRDPISVLAFSPDGGLLASASAGTVRLWNIAAKLSLPIGAPLVHPSAVTGVAFSHDSRQLASVDEGGLLLLWDVSGRHLLSQPLPVPDGVNVSNLTISPDGGTLAIAACVLFDQPTSRCIRSAVDLWDMAAGPRVKGQVAEQSGRILDIQFSPDGRQLATSNTDGAVVLSDLADGASRQLSHGHTGPVLTLAFHPLHKALATGGTDRLVRQWHLDTGELIGAERTLSAAVTSVSYKHDGKVLAAATLDGRVVVLDTVSDTPLRPPPVGDDQQFNPRARVAFSARGQLAYSGADRAVRIVQPGQTTAQRILLPSASTGRGQVVGLAFNPDGSTLAVASEDNTIRIWEVDNALETGTLTAGGYQSRQMVFANAGQTLVSGGDDSVQLWDLRPRSWLARACETVARSLDDREWRNFVAGWQTFLQPGGWREYAGPLVERVAPPVGMHEKVCV